MTRLTTIPYGSVEHLEAEVTAGVTLDTEGVELSLSRDGLHTWLSATWAGDPGTTRTARTATPVDTTAYNDELYSLYARVTADPEIPVIYVGRVLLH